MKRHLTFTILLFVSCVLSLQLFEGCSKKKVKFSVIPRAVLFGNPVKTSPQVSPDGLRLAYLAPVNDVLNIWIKTVGKDDDNPVTKDSVRGIRRYFWAFDNKHVIYLQDRGGDENWRLYATDISAGTTRDMTPFENVQVQILEVNKRFPDDILLMMNKDNPALHDVYRLNVPTGNLELVAKNTGNVQSWVADAAFQIRGAVASRNDGGYDMLVRDDVQSPWRTLVTWNFEDAMNSAPVGFSKDGTHIYLGESRDANAARLVKVELASGKREVLAEDPLYDVTEIQVDPDTYEVDAVAFMRERLEWKALVPEWKKDLKAIAKLHDGDFRIVNTDAANNAWIVSFMVDDGPVSYYLYDRKSRKGTFLFVNRPDLDAYLLASMEPVSFKARDGLTIHGYMTFPPDKKSRNLPMVLLVHGGPWGRDTWGFNPYAQWLANRGYLVFQVNFRGSTGYGKKFVTAGDKEWAGKMHDDLVDAVQWAVKKKYADPAKVAIMGGSYGGYAALVGATFTPDLFRCAVDIVGPSNLVTLLRSFPPYWSTFRMQFYKRVGNPDTEEAFLKSRSPLFKVDQIKIPILIGQGANDPRVKQAESEQIVAAMRAKGLAVEYMLFPDEGHGFARPENTLKFNEATEKFLAKYLGGRVEGEPEPVKGK